MIKYTACHYCGFVDDKRDVLRLPICEECRGLLRDSGLEKEKERGKYVKYALAEKYAHVLELPNWSKGELDELGDNLRLTVEASLILKREIQARLKW